MQNFNKELALTLIESDIEYPVNFDDAWQWLGYGSKQSAKKKLTRNFKEGIDYSSKWMSVAHSSGLTASRSEAIYLTVECFKMLGMMAGTEKGREIREYFLECEDEIKKAQSEPQLQQPASTTALPALTALEYAKKSLITAGIELPIVESWVLMTLANQVDIENKNIYLNAQKHLASRIELPEQLVTVTELCKLLEDRSITIKPQALNKQLCEMGLQLLTRDSKGKIQYQLAEKGEGMGKLILNSTGSGKNVSQLKWYAGKVVDAIADACVVLS